MEQDPTGANVTLDQFLMSTEINMMLHLINFCEQLTNLIEIVHPQDPMVPQARASLAQLRSSIQKLHPTDASPKEPNISDLI